LDHKEKIMAKAKKKTKHVRRHWTQDNERENVMKAIIEGRKAGLTWSEVSQDIYNRGNIYVSPSALQQRWTHSSKNEEVVKVVKVAKVAKARKTKTTPDHLPLPNITDHLSLAKIIESMIEGKVAAAIANVKTKVNELDEQFTKVFSGIIKLEKIINNLRDEVNSYGK
jgi:hypothetical protein